MSDVLDQKKAWILKAFGNDALGSPVPRQSTADLVARLRALSPGLQTLNQAGSPALADVAKAVAKASEALKTGAANAAALVEDAETKLHAATETSSSPQGAHPKAAGNPPPRRGDTPALHAGDPPQTGAPTGASPVPTAGATPSGNAPPAPTPPADPKAKAYEDALKKVTDRLAVLTQTIAKPEVDKVRNEVLPAADRLAKASPPDFDGAVQALAPATALLDLADLHTRRYASALAVTTAAYTQVKSTFDNAIKNTDWKTLCPITPGIEDVLTDIKAKGLDAAATAATASDYGKAMVALDLVTPGLQPLYLKQQEMDAYMQSRSEHRDDYHLALNAMATDALRNAMTAQVGKILTDSQTIGATGDFKAALAKLMTMDEPQMLFQDVSTGLKNAKAAINLLTDANVATDKAALTTKCVDGATTAIAANDLAKAKTLVHEAVTVAPQILAYSQALTAAETGMANPKLKPADAQIIRDNQFAAAKAAAGKGDYAGGAALLKRVDPAVQNAANGMDMQGRFDAETAALVTRIAAIDATLAKEKTDLTATYVAAAKTAFKPDDPKAALALLAQGQLACGPVETLQAEAKAYATALTAATTAVGTLTDPILAADKTEITTKMIDVAKAHAAKHEFKQALEALAPVDGAVFWGPQIVGQKQAYDPLLAEVTKNRNSAVTSIAQVATSGLPARPDLQAAVDAVNNTYLNPAKNAVDHRGIGKAANDALTKAVDLLEKAKPISFNAWAEAYYYVHMAQERTTAQHALTALKAEPGAKHVAPEIGEIDKRMQNADILAQGKKSQTAGNLYDSVAGDCAEVTKTARGAETYTTGLAAAKTRVEACKKAVDALAPPPPALLDRYNAMHAAVIDQAVKLAGAREWAAASALLVTTAVNKACEPIETLAKDATAYAKELAAAKLERAKLAAAIVKPEADRIDSQLLVPADAAAAKLDYVTARALVAKVAPEVAAALKTATDGAAALKARGDAQGALDGDIPGAVKAVQALLAPLLAHPEHAAIQDRIDKIQAAIAAGSTAPPAQNAKQLLTEAADLCPVARTEADRAAGFKTALATAKAAAAKLVAAVVTKDRDQIEKTDIPAAEALVKPPAHDFTAAMAALDKVDAAVKAAEAIAKRDAAFKLEQQKAQTAIDAVHFTGTSIEADMEKIQTDRVNKAATLATARDYDGAEKLLDGIETDIKTLALSLKMSGGTAPTAADMADIIKQPGGTKKLDDMVARLPESTPKAVFEAAIKVRFTLNSFQNVQPGSDDPVEGAGKGKSLKKLYELMASVPEAHTRNNPSLAQVERHGDQAGTPPNAQRGSYYAGGTDKKIVLSCGRGDDADPQPLSGTFTALPDVEPDCELVPNSPASPAPKYFDWTTLHEVGHAIDDKKKFMDGKAGDAAFGNWAVHNGDVVPVAKAIASATKLTGQDGERFLTTYLLQKKGTEPPAPPGRADWADVVKAAKEWCDGIRVDKELWESATGSKKFQAGGRVYHEAYGGTWVSYDLAARTKGITGYQFRAPGEWLSELYAAYHSKKLKDSHPAVAWLATL
jgi:hypothetical protein